MSILKSKIARALVLHQICIFHEEPNDEVLFDQITKPQPLLEDINLKDQKAKPSSTSRKSKTSKTPKSPESCASTSTSDSYSRHVKTSTKGTNSAKNIVKNYGRAFASFALSDLSQPYLPLLLTAEGLTLQDFRQFVATKKESIDGISSLRDVLLIDENDSEVSAMCKRVFREIAVIFIKYFSVNWIYNSRVYNKEAHLNFRFRMLRRVKQPEYFTYLKAPEVFGEKLSKQRRY